MGATPLHTAMEYSFNEGAALLFERQVALDAKVPVDTQDQQGRSALQWAVMHGNLAGATLLIDQGANLDLRNEVPTLDRYRTLPVTLCVVWTDSFASGDSVWQCGGCEAADSSRSQLLSQKQGTVRPDCPCCRLLPRHLTTDVGTRDGNGLCSISESL